MPLDAQLDELRKALAELTERVSALERTTSAASAQVRMTARDTSAPPSAISPARPVIAQTDSRIHPAKPAPHPASPQSAAASTASLESKIGGQWLNRIGIVAVLVGVSYFLKYAFDNNWIGPAGRIAIGLLAGAAVVLWSEAFRRRGYRLFSYSLKAVGIGILYLSLWGAFQVYALIPATAAFAGMILITVFTAVLAFREDAQIIAAFAVAGGFSTPVLLSTGQNHEVVLFSYVAILDAATLALIAYKPWKRLLLGSFFGTVILYAGWHSSYYRQSELEVTLFFASLFFLIFAVAPLITCDQQSRIGLQASGTLVSITLLNGVAYFFAVMAMLDYLPSKDEQPLLAWAAVVIAAVYIILNRTIRPLAARDGKTNSAIPLLHLAVAVGFLTIAVPLKLNSHWITIGWLIESAVLIWIGERSKTKLLQAMGVIALGLGIARLIFIDNFYPHTLLWNMRFATYLVAIAVLAALTRFALGVPKYRDYARITGVAINILALLALSHEVADFFARRMTATNYLYTQQWSQLRIARDFSFSALYMVYGAALMITGFWKKSAFLRWQALLLIAATIAKVFIYDLSELEKVYRVLSFIALGVLLLGISFLYQRDWLKLHDNSKGAASGGSSAR